MLKGPLRDFAMIIGKDQRRETRPMGKMIYLIKDISKDSLSPNVDGRAEGTLISSSQMANDGSKSYHPDPTPVETLR